MSDAIMMMSMQDVPTIRNVSRYLEMLERLEIDTRNGGTAWADVLPGAEVVLEGDHRLRLRVDAGVDLRSVMDRAAASGEIRQFSFGPPSLSEVFREAVGQ